MTVITGIFKQCLTFSGALINKFTLESTGLIHPVNGKTESEQKQPKSRRLFFLPSSLFILLELKLHY
jgi:hypothetical protein